MPYETSIDAVQILRSTLYLLEHAEFPQKHCPVIEEVVLHLRQAIADLEAARLPPARESGEVDEDAELA